MERKPRLLKLCDSCGLYLPRKAFSSNHKKFCKDCTKARKAFYTIYCHALYSGQLTRPVECPKCKSSDQTIQAHHPCYDPGHELHIEWLCPTCHKAEHNRLYENRFN